MKKILIVSFYDLKDYLMYIKELFEEYNFTVINYPLFRYAYDANDKIENYKEHMNDYIKTTNPDIILWWFIDVPVDVFKYIKQQNNDKMFILYNSDDPINLNKELFDKAKIFDIVMTPCKDTMYLYKLYSNVQCVLFNPMGYDPNLFKPIETIVLPENEYKEYKCDISMIIYNMFSDINYYDQVIQNKIFIENIIKLSDEKNYKLKLYGTPLLKELYPNNYHGEVPYYKLNLLFNSSKINIITSPFKNKELHITDYVIPIMSCNGLLMHDKTKNIDKILIDGHNCVLFDETNYIDKINNVLNNYNKYDQIKLNAQKTAENYSWNKWVENIMINIGTKLFNKEIYAELYDLNTNDNLLNYWLEYGINKKQICYDFYVPDIFNHDAYSTKYNLKKNKRIAYLHWFSNSRDEIYLNKNNSSTIDFNPEEYNIIMEDYFNIFSLFNKIVKYDTREQSLENLSDYCNQVPNIKINDILNRYIEMTF